MLWIIPILILSLCIYTRIYMIRTKGDRSMKYAIPFLGFFLALSILMFCISLNETITLPSWLNKSPDQMTKSEQHDFNDFMNYEAGVQDNSN